jgi:hypothetical protein
MGTAELEQVRGLLAAHPDWSRYRLSCELCRVWICQPLAFSPAPKAHLTNSSNLRPFAWNSPE